MIDAFVAKDGSLALVHDEPELAAGARSATLTFATGVVTVYGVGRVCRRPPALEQTTLTAMTINAGGRHKIPKTLALVLVGNGIVRDRREVPLAIV